MAGICVPTDLPRITGPAFLSSPACLVVNTWEFLGGGDTRGASVIVPRRIGRISQPFRRDETAYELQLIIVGDVDAAGDPRGLSSGEGLEASLNDLRTEVIDPGLEASVWTLTLPSGATRAANVQVKGSKFGQVVEGFDRFGISGMAMTATLSVLLRAGTFT